MATSAFRSATSMPIIDDTRRLRTSQEDALCVSRMQPVEQRCPLLFRDRHCGYMLALAHDVKGSLWTGQYEEDELPSSEVPASLHVDKIVVIEPNGGYIQHADNVRLTKDELVRLGADDPKNPSTNGPIFEQPSTVDAQQPSCEYDVKGRAPGCRDLCGTDAARPNHPATKHLLRSV